MQSLLNQRTEKQERKLLIGGLIVHRDSVTVGVNYEAKYAVVVGALYYPVFGHELESDKNLMPIREIRAELDAQYGEEWSPHDYRAPQKARHIVLAEYTATSLGDLNDVLDRLHRQFEARCFCPAQDRDFAAASQLCQPVSTVHDKDFLISNAESILEEPGRVKVMQSCQRLANRDTEGVLAAAVAFYELERRNFRADPTDYRRLEEKEKDFIVSYSYQ
jgi:hypothetical protein